MNTTSKPNPSRTVLVTGATGFIGSALVAQLLARGDSVVALSRNATKARRKLGARVQIVESLAQIAPSAVIDAVVNLAGEPLAGGPWNAARKRRFVDSRVQTTAQLIDLFERLASPPAVLVNGSAVGYYGERGDDTLDERDGPRDEFLSTLCQQWEAEARRAEMLGLRVCLLRTGLVFGAGGGLLAPLLLSSRLGLGAVFADGRQWQPWIHMDDEIGLILHLIDHPTLSGPFNATSPEPVTQRALMDAIAAELRRPRWLRVPASLLKLSGEMSVLFTVSQRVLPTFALESGYVFRYPTLAAALRQIIGR